MYGSISWNLKATVHRPGKFVPRMETARTINVVATPSDDATEDVESVTVTKTWEDQMVYNLSIVGLAFPIGSKIPIQLTILPLAKIRILKVSVVIDGVSLQHIIATSVLTVHSPSSNRESNVLHPRQDDREAPQSDPASPLFLEVPGWEPHTYTPPYRRGSSEISPVSSRPRRSRVHRTNRSGACLGVDIGVDGSWTVATPVERRGCRYQWIATPDEYE
jgi:hypothetical protein